MDIAGRGPSRSHVDYMFSELSSPQTRSANSAAIERVVQKNCGLESIESACVNHPYHCSCRIVEKASFHASH